ncbi:hypothetical protein [Longimicrobium sp.]|uniref:hypothetical protein n=1 Tax=Longimicrobium sp. TaxID=2029185 RepID=UPI002CDD6CBF|nr:hypothetical protein [Longimicrobium sp.]HSU13691.1 hypothetical protein [Longimicrobium sp.]
MRTTTRVLLPALLAALAAAPVAAQNDTPGGGTQPVPSDSAKVEAAQTFFAGAQQIPIQNYRPTDKRGLNMFEAPKNDGVPYDGFKLLLGAAFTQQFQTIGHSNTAGPKVVGGVDQNALVEIGPGFNNAVANLYLTAQLARGISVHMTSYLSSRHHSETWVKDGFILIDSSPVDVPLLNGIMKYTTLRVGEMELNYGDSHFRRTDNGNAVYNPFVGNLIMDPFTTEAGAEVYVRSNGFLAMGGITAGQLHPSVTDPRHRTPSFLGKLGFDRQLTPELRLRLTGSVYTNPHSTEQNLFSGDRAGSRYYFVMENAAPTSTENATLRSGMLNPGMNYALTSWVINPFVKFNGLELFGQIEQAHGRARTETENRTWKQYAVDATYRFLPGEPLFVAARYNTVRGPLAVATPTTPLGGDVGADRWQASAGWYITDNILLKGEYVTQKYTGYADTSIFNGGKFNGFIFEGTVAF